MDIKFWMSNVVLEKLADRPIASQKMSSKIYLHPGIIWVTKVLMNGKYGFQFRWHGKLIKKYVDPGIYQLTPLNSILAGKAWNSTFIPVWI